MIEICGRGWDGGRGELSRGAGAGSATGGGRENKTTVAAATNLLLDLRPHVLLLDLVLVEHLDRDLAGRGGAETRADEGLR
jgi:hypothetical protein